MCARHSEQMTTTEISTLTCSICDKACRCKWDEYTRHIRFCKMCFRIECGGECKPSGSLSHVDHICTSAENFSENKRCFMVYSYELSAGSSFLRRVPKADLKTLPFPEWNPFWCHRCGTPYSNTKAAATPIICILCETVRCKGCFGEDMCCPECLLSGGLKQEVKWIQKATEEMRSLFGESAHSNDASRFSSAPLADLPEHDHFLKLESFRCEKCVKYFDSETFPVFCNGKLLCDRCKTVPYVYMDELLSNFHMFCSTIANPMDLKGMDYSAWTPIRCASCDRPYTEEPEHMPKLNTQGQTKCATCFGDKAEKGQCPADVPWINNCVKELRNLFE